MSNLDPKNHIQKLTKRQRKAIAFRENKKRRKETSAEENSEKVEQNFELDYGSEREDSTNVIESNNGSNKEARQDSGNESTEEGSVTEGTNDNSNDNEKAEHNIRFISFVGKLFIT